MSNFDHMFVLGDFYGYGPEIEKIRADLAALKVDGDAKRLELRRINDAAHALGNCA